MPHFIYDNTTLPADKSNLTPMPGGADPNKFEQGSDFNSLKGALNDTRDFVTNGRWLGLGDGTLADVSASSKARLRAISGFLQVSENGTPYRPVFQAQSWDVKSKFGVVADGSTDDTAAVQAALDFGLAEMNAARACQLVFPVGDIKITSTLLWRGNSALAPSLVGPFGPGDAFDHSPTTFHWYGAANGSLLFAEHANKGFISNLAFDGRDVAGCLLELSATTLADRAVLASTSGIRVEHCHLFDVKHATVGNALVKLGTDPALTGGDTLQQSEVVFRDCSFRGESPGAIGFTLAGMKAACIRTMAGGNCKNFAVYDCEFAYADVAIDWNRSSGNFNVTNFNGAQIRTAFISSDSELCVSGGDVECNCDDFKILTGTGGGGAASAKIESVEFVAFMAGVRGRPIEWAGNLEFHRNLIINGNSSVEGGSIGNPYDLMIGFGSVDSFGNFFECPNGSAYVDYAPYVDGSNNPLTPSIGSYYAYGPEGLVRSEGDQYTRVVGAGPTPLKSHNLRAERYQQLSVSRTMPLDNLPAVAEYAGELRRAWHKIVVPYTAYQTAALFKDVPIGQYLAGMVIRRVIADVTAALGGTAGTLNLKCGWTVGGDEVFVDKDVKSAPVRIGDDPADFNVAGLGSAAGLFGGVCPDRVTQWFLRTRLTSSSGNLSGLNAGSITFYIETELL